MRVLSYRLAHHGHMRELSRAASRAMRSASADAFILRHQYHKPDAMALAVGQCVD